MSDQIEASSSSIIELTKGINSCLRKISELNTELSEKLKILGTTFQDDGFYTIQGYVSKAQKNVDEAVPDIGLVLEVLVEYARLLQESEKYIS